MFIWNEDDKIEQITWELSNASEQEAFDSIREIVTLVSETEAKVQSRYKRSVNVYRNVKNKIKGRVFKHRVAKGFYQVARIKELLTVCSVEYFHLTLVVSIKFLILYEN